MNIKYIMNSIYLSPGLSFIPNVTVEHFLDFLREQIRSEEKRFVTSY